MVKLISKVNQIEVLGHDSAVISMDYVPSRQNIMEETPAGNRFIEEPGYYIFTSSS